MFTCRTEKQDERREREMGRRGGSVNHHGSIRPIEGKNAMRREKFCSHEKKAE